ncbi:hypothetical protein HBH56_242330 [Parastagonospora nodorum]|uniref:Uncharacterized protein n=1 Tax=Phaeosphaeria nodorum (strain SN15 / ATCC MYA-4574 / FGSC 10173) TaxID=321614 RepID=Q0UY19_PHANO|nr:hypothetical protein SNOG_03345 [Parastagonospora nodorum SN15]KAH3903907.1 hypothetical protein HBH56_242330 [Parastagonospora nodorum]EAT88550.1 hypothetical protein SNOG_03345 [Parastagonospora nodorum SN15]KAH3921134.1 hypothetical protein HBH54_244910 [Parastagonospora nodorum]KAH3954594.1 hypothetical protein HBH53_009640 [Parastagonospora nodorum]KAH3985984.1 hypothetical protein HBH52_040830 [Parastagonospora nodorum]
MEPSGSSRELPIRPAQSGISRTRVSRVPMIPAHAAATAGLAIYLPNTSTARTGRSNKRPRDNVGALNHPVATATSGSIPTCAMFSLAKPMSLSPPTKT